MAFIVFPSKCCFIVTLSKTNEQTQLFTMAKWWNVEFVHISMNAILKANKKAYVFQNSMMTSNEFILMHFESHCKCIKPVITILCLPCSEMLSLHTFELYKTLEKWSRTSKANYIWLIWIFSNYWYQNTISELNTWN